MNNSGNGYPATSRLNLGSVRSIKVGEIRRFETGLQRKIWITQQNGITIELLMWGDNEEDLRVFNNFETRGVERPTVSLRPQSWRTRV